MYIFGDGGGAVLFEPNFEGLGWEDEYFRSNGTDRMSLGIKAGGSLYPTSEETLNKGWHNIYQDGKQYLNMLSLRCQMLQNK